MDDSYARLQRKYNALQDAVARMMTADSPGVWNAKEYMTARAEVKRILADKKYSRHNCPKSDTWFANGGACGRAWDCANCADAPKAALVGIE